MKRIVFFSILALCVCVIRVNAANQIFDVREFGAKGDGKTIDTEAIQKALDACGKAGGGTVKFSAGTYLSRPITLRTKTTVQLEADAILKATDEPADFLRDGVTWDEILAGKKKGPFDPFIGGKDLEDVTIEGKGTIDGSGAKWWIPAEEARRKVSGYTLPRPNLVVLNRCKNVRLSGITLLNSPKFHFVPTDCDGVRVEDVTVLAPERAANTDAIDPSRCRDVIITRCHIDVGDDNVAIKSGKKVPGREFACENITITDCVFVHGHGVSIGSETVGGVRNVTVKNCRFENTENGIRIKSRRGRGGRVEDITYENLTMTNVYPALSFAGYYQDSSQLKFLNEDKAQPVTETTPQFKNIRVINLTANSLKGAGVIVGLPECLMTNVVLENVHIKAKTGLTIANAKDVQLRDVTITVEKGEPFILHNAEVSGLPESATQ
ncbi:MAG TPA: glycoside hydrolase family 28 protein [Verrucomicrobiae bacterium]|nr:glycoside hydrolase family 28 protein [Verrucomicrobiae bacterium]